MNLRRPLFWLVSLAILIGTLSTIESLSGSAGSASTTSNDDPETTEIVVKLDPLSDATIAAINEAYGTTTLEELLGSRGIYRLRAPAGENAHDVAQEMTRDVRLLYAEPNFQSEAPEGNPSHINEWGAPEPLPVSNDYATAMLGLNQAHSLNRGAGIKVAVLDTGIQLGHPVLVNHMTSARYDFVEDDEMPADEGNGLDDDGDGLVDEALGHGTHVAGIIQRVAPDAQIMPLRVLDADGRGNIFVVAEAMLYAVQHGAQVLNLSLGTTQESELMKDILEELAQNHDVVTVAAAGNLNSLLEQFPASEDEVLAVTSLNHADKKSDFANYGDWIDVAAPGETIVSTFPIDHYAVWSGTSMAVPFVAGQAALMRSAVPTMTVPYVVAHIRDSAQSIDALNPGFEGLLGAGRIDIGGSLLALCNTDGSCSVPDLTGKVTLETEALVEVKPPNGLIGQWVIGGTTYLADVNTEFRQDRGALGIGVCASVEYVNTSPFSALRIRSREIDDCNAPSQTPTSTPMPTSTPDPTATLTSTATPQPTAAATGTPLPSRTPADAPTPRPTEVPTQGVISQSRGYIITMPPGGREGEWLIDDVTYIVTSTTALDAALRVGATVDIHSYVAANGELVAVRIEAVILAPNAYLPLVSN